MRKRKDFVRSFAERLDAAAEMLRELERKNDAVEARFYEKYGDRANAVLDLQKRIYEKLGGRFMTATYQGLELKVFHFEPYVEPIESMIQELYALRGETQKKFWSRDWKCPCGDSFTLWVNFDGAGDYRIHCESCFTRCGKGSQEEMEDAVARGVAKDITTRRALEKARFPHDYMCRQVASRLGVKVLDLPPYLGTKGHSVEDHVRNLADLPAQLEK